jgi:DNA-binding FadR family transcriptional regulator
MRIMPTDTSLKPISRRRAYELAADQIRRQIVAGVWQVGDRIPPERELADQLAISRGSTREALRLLEAMGWLEIRPGEGAIVRDRSRVPLISGGLKESFGQSAQLAEIWEARKIIEPQAASLAAERANETSVREIRSAIELMELLARNERWADAIDQNFAFHLAVARASENSVVLQMQEMLAAASMRAERAIGPAQTPDRVWKVIREHTEIFQAIQAGDPEAAHRAQFDHLVTSWMAEWLPEKPGGS